MDPGGVLNVGRLATLMRGPAEILSEVEGPVLTWLATAILAGKPSYWTIFRPKSLMFKTDEPGRGLLACGNLPVIAKKRCCGASCRPQAS